MARIPVKMIIDTRTEWHQIQARSCPFCGNDSILDLQSQAKNGAWKVWCTTCGALGPPAQNVDEAVAKWNKKPPVNLNNL